MLSTLAVVLPVFATILAGWLARRIGVLGAHATKELSRFVVYLALPALLFDIVANARVADIWMPGFAGAFGLGSVVVFAGAVAIRRRESRPLADVAIDGLNAAYANTGFLGFPLAVAALGRDALAPTLIATIITVCAVFAAAIVLIEIGLQTERRRGPLIAKVARSLARNPLLVAPALGLLFPLSGLTVPAPVDSFLRLLGGAASPCALAALGLFLAAERGEEEPAEAGVTTLLVALKLVAHPLVTWVFAVYAFRLDPPLVHAAVLMAALPTGTGSFMLAEHYQREVAVTSRVVLISTMLSVLTVSAYLASIR
ncbi:AEC family transporter [Hansschlegelia beijingensis]